MRKLRIGLIGASNFARKNHYPSLRCFDDVEIAAICEPVVSKREECAREFDVPQQFKDHIEMIENTPLDAVYAVMAPHRSYDVLLRCISEGLPTFMEKPAVVDSSHADKLAEAAAQSGTLTFVGFNRRFMPIMREARKRVEAGGPLTHCVSTYYKHRPDALYFDGAVDFFISDTIHAVDTLRWMGGEVANVAAATATQHGPRRNAVSAVVNFQSGATGVLQTNWAAATRVCTFEMHSLNCSAFINPDGTSTILHADADEPVLLDVNEVSGSSEQRITYGFEAENRCFVDCVKARRPPENDIADAARTHKLIDNILRNVI